MDRNQFTKEEFEGMVYNVHAIPFGKKVLDVHPELAKWEEFRANIGASLSRHRDKVIRYTILLYDRKSPLHELEDIGRRKIHAALLAKLPQKNKEWSEETLALLRGQNAGANEMAIRYCRIVAPIKYSQAVACQAALKQMQLDLMDTTPVSKEDRLDAHKKKGDIWKKSKEMETDLTGYYDELLANDRTLALQHTLMLTVDMSVQQLKLRPEDQALLDVDRVFRIG